MDGYIQDRLNNPVHVPKLGTVKAIRLEAPAESLVRRVVEARLRPVLEEIPEGNDLPDIYPFADEQITRIAKSEPTLRDMLQQFRHLFDHVVYEAEETASPVPKPNSVARSESIGDDEPVLKNALAFADIPTRPESRISGYDTFNPPVGPIPFPELMTATDKQNRIDALLGKDPEIYQHPVAFKSVTIVETTESGTVVGLSRPTAEPNSHDEQSVVDRKSVV